MIRYFLNIPYFMGVFKAGNQKIDQGDHGDTCEKSQGGHHISLERPQDCLEGISGLDKDFNQGNIDHDSCGKSQGCC
ncbi:MAG: hypothetical protein LC660_16860 [Desulfobacteraceae bacterium]|nr:hypothetical protein [Desulfobacteraceae bacterium]